MAATRHSSAPHSAADLELRGALEKTGLRCTRQRAAVYHFLRAHQTHPTAEEVFAGVQHDLPHISLATIYKALDALVESGLVRKVHNLEGPSRFECHRESHYHFHCLSTREIVDLPIPYDPDLIAKLAPDLLDNLRRQGFQVTGYRLEFEGFVQAN